MNTPTAQTAPEGAQITPLPWSYRQHSTDPKRFVLISPNDKNKSGCGSVYGESMAASIVEKLNSHAALTASNAELRRALEDTEARAGAALLDLAGKRADRIDALVSALTTCERILSLMNAPGRNDPIEAAEVKIAGLPRRMGDQMVRDHCRSMERQRDEARELLLSIKQSVDNGDVTAMTAKGERALALLTPKPTP